MNAMACILNIETATEACSVVVSKNGQIIFEREETVGPSHAVLLGQFVNEAVHELRTKGIALDAVAVSCGPGSYTGLRIGVSEAKGLCYGLGVPLIAINTLKIMANGLLRKQRTIEDALLCPMIDARRMEVYDVVYNVALEEIRTVAADIIDEAFLSDTLSNQKVMFFGNGALKCQSVLISENAIFVEGIYPRASDMVDLAEAAYENKSFVDTAYFEPFYLKEFVATTPKNKVLGQANL